MDIVYFANVQTPGKRYFSCLAGFGTLSVEACAQRHWNKRYETCNRCPVGQVHAGCEPLRLDLHNRCCHCLKQSMRFTFGLCDSCYVHNRSRLALFCGYPGVNVKAIALVGALLRLIQTAGHRRYFYYSDQPIERPAKFDKKRRAKPKHPKQPIIESRSLDLWGTHAGTAL
jgi:hypothetical protein